jgi:iron(III) transport system permease protein
VGGTLKLAQAIRRWRRHEGHVAFGAAVLILALAAALPLFQLLIELGGVAGEASRLLLRARPWQLLGYSVALSTAVTVTALFVGIPLGVLLARTDVPGRRWVWALHAFPMTLPPFLLALGWFRVFGRQGALGGEATSGLLFGPVGVVMVLALGFTPLVTSLVAVALMGVDASQEEAGRVMARPMRVVTRILLPAVKPAIALAAVLVFTLTLSELGVPMFLRVEVFPAAVFARLGTVDYAPGEALALVLPLIPVVIGLMLLERRLVGGRSFAVLGMRAGLREPLSLGPWKIPLSVASWVVAAWGLAPLAALAAQAVRGTSARELAAWARSAPLNSLLTSAAAATIMTVLGIVLGHALARHRRFAGLVDRVAVQAFVTPAAVLGVGLIALWNRPATGALYGSAAILVIGFVGRYAAVAVRACAVAISQVPATFEEAAAASGATYAKRMVRIVIPTARRGIAFAWLAAFVFCVRDLESSILYYPPGGEPLTVRIFTLEANGPDAVVAGLACLQVALTALAVGAGVLVFRKGAPA